MIFVIKIIDDINHDQADQAVREAFYFLLTIYHDICDKNRLTIHIVQTI